MCTQCSVTFPQDGRPWSECFGRCPFLSDGLNSMGRPRGAQTRRLRPPPMRGWPPMDSRCTSSARALCEGCVRGRGGDMSLSHGSCDGFLLLLRLRQEKQVPHSSTQPGIPGFRSTSRQKIACRPCCHETYLNGSRFEPFPPHGTRAPVGSMLVTFLEAGMVPSILARQADPLVAKAPGKMFQENLETTRLLLMLIFGAVFSSARSGGVGRG